LKSIEPGGIVPKLAKTSFSTVQGLLRTGSLSLKTGERTVLKGFTGFFSLLPS
jgi:hypothetical protein